MMIVIVVTIALPVCFIVLLIGCLNCLQRKKKIETFRSRDTTGRLDTAFSVDIGHIPDSSDHVVIDPLPDILSKVSTVQPQRPQIICTEKTNREANLHATTGAQRSFPRDQLTYLNEIGSGWFGKAIESEAFQIVGGNFKSHVVVKMLKDDASKLEQKQFLDEVTAFRCLEDANIMSLLGQCTETSPFLVILEFAAYGSLKNYLVHNRDDVGEIIASNRLVSLALDAASGLACLQRHGYIHNDLAARNCLITSDHTLKIGDYGISDYLFKNEYYNSGPVLLPIRWIAPEILAKVDGVWTAHSYSKVSDMWSFGVLLWEIFSLGEFPYDNLTDDAVLQEVVLDRRLLPSEMDIKIPFKDRVWPIMLQCWQNPTDRLDVEQVFNSLEQLNRTRDDTVDTMSDFDQKWNQLEQNQTRTSSIGTELGSRIALAGSFLTEHSSSSSDKSALDEDTKSQDGTKSDDIFINIGDEDMHNSRNLGNQTVPTISVHSTDTDRRLNMQQNNGIKSHSQARVVTEKELTKISVSPSHAISPSHAMSPRASDQSVVKTSVPALQDQSPGSYFHSPDSSLSSEYMTATEAYTTSNSQKERVKYPSDVAKDFSLALEGKTFEEVLDKAPQKPSKPGNDVSSFQFPYQTEDEDFSDFVRTSPTAPALDFTDFASADNLPSAKVVRAADKTEIKKSALLDESVTQPGNDVTVAESNFFSELTEAPGEKNSWDDDLDTFSDFVNSEPYSKANSSIVVVAEVNTTASDNVTDNATQRFFGEDTALNLDLSFMTPEFSIFSGPERVIQNEDVAVPSTEIHSQTEERVADLKSKVETAAIHSQAQDDVADLKSETETNSTTIHAQDDVADFKSETETNSATLHSQAQDDVADLKSETETNSTAIQAQDDVAELKSETETNSTTIQTQDDVADLKSETETNSTTIQSQAQDDVADLKSETEINLATIHSQAQDDVVDLKSKTETSSAAAAILSEKVSTPKVVPDQNQNIFSLENMPSDMSSLISEASLVNDAGLHLGTTSEVSTVQSQQSETLADSENPKEISSLESLEAHVPTSTDFFADYSTDSFDFDKSNSMSVSLDFLGGKLESDSTQSTDPTALEDDGKTQNDSKKESDFSTDIFDSSFEPVFDNLPHVSSKQETTLNSSEVNLSSSAPDNNFENSEQVTVAEHTSPEDFKPVENLLGLDFLPQLNSSQAQQADLMSENQESNESRNEATAQETGSLIDF